MTVISKKKVLKAARVLVRVESFTARDTRRGYRYLNAVWNSLENRRLTSTDISNEQDLEEALLNGSRSWEQAATSAGAYPFEGAEIARLFSPKLAEGAAWAPYAAMEARTAARRIHDAYRYFRRRA